MRFDLAMPCVLAVVGLLCGCSKEETTANFVLASNGSVTLISPKVNNGSFEDWEGAKTKALGATDQALLGQLSVRADEDGKSSIPSWVLKGEGTVRFTTGHPATHLHRRCTISGGNRMQLLSDGCGEGLSYSKGDRISLSYDLIAVIYGFIIEETPPESWPVITSQAYMLFEEPDAIDNALSFSSNVQLVERVHPPQFIRRMTADSVKGEMVLTVEQAALANKNGLRLLITFNGSTSASHIDNVRLVYWPANRP